MAGADSGTTLAKRKAKAKKKPARRTNRLDRITDRPAPEPIASESQPEPTAEPEKKTSLFSNLFTAKVQDAATGSGEPLLECEALPAEVQAALDRVPDVVTDEVQPEMQPGQGSAEAALIGAVVQSFVFDEKTIRTGLVWTFDALADRRGEHCRLDSDRLNRVVGPTTQMANQAWVSVRDYLPTLLSKAVDTTPGLMAFLIGWGSVLTPMYLADRAAQAAQASHEWKAVGKIEAVAAKVEAAGKDFIREQLD